MYTPYRLEEITKEGGAIDIAEMIKSGRGGEISYYYRSLIAGAIGYRKGQKKKAIINKAIIGNIEKMPYSAFIGMYIIIHNEKLISRVYNLDVEKIIAAEKNI